MKNIFKKGLNRAFSSLLVVAFGATSLTGQPSLLIAATATEVPTSLADRQSLESLPSGLGTLKELSPAQPGQPFIIHIQSAHANPSAQTHIRKILHWLEEKQKDKSLVIGLEGAVGEIHPEYFEFDARYPELGDAVAADLHQKGELTGAELFAWDLYKRWKVEGRRSKGKKTGLFLPPSTFDLPPVFVGIETPDLYRENLKTYRELLFRSEEVESLLQGIRKQIEIEKSRYLSPALKKFHREKERRKEGRFNPDQSLASLPQIDAYLRYLSAKVKEILGIDLADAIEQVRFPNLTRVLIVERLQKTTDERQAKQEEEQVLKVLQARGNLKNRLSEDQNIRLRDQVSEDQNNLISDSLKSPSDSSDALIVDLKMGDKGEGMTRSTVEHLWQFALDHQINLKAYPDYLKMLGQWILRSGIESEGLFEEMGRLEGLLVEKLAVSEKEKEVVKQMEEFSLLEKLLTLKLTREEWLRLNENPKHEIRNPRQTPISQKRQKANVLKLGHPDFEFVSDFDIRISDLYQEALHFYKTAVLRDQALLENLLKIESQAPSKILITGGFHTEGMLESMRQKGIGYAVIQPRIAQVEKDLYLKVFKDVNADLRHLPKNVISVWFSATKIGGAALNFGGTKQQALFLRALYEMILPALAKKRQLSENDARVLASEMSQRHPVLSSVPFTANAVEEALLMGAGYDKLRPASFDLAKWSNAKGGDGLSMAPEERRGSKTRDQLQGKGAGINDGYAFPGARASKKNPQLQPDQQIQSKQIVPFQSFYTSRRRRSLGQIQAATTKSNTMTTPNASFQASGNVVAIQKDIRDVVNRISEYLNNESAIFSRRSDFAMKGRINQIQEHVNKNNIYYGKYIYGIVPAAAHVLGNLDELIILTRSPSRAETRMTPEQMENLERVYRAWGIDVASAPTPAQRTKNQVDRIYVERMTAQHILPKRTTSTDPNAPDAPLKIRTEKGSFEQVSELGNGVVTALLNGEELKRYGVYQRRDLESDPEKAKQYRSASSKTYLIWNTLDGGIGEGLMREAWLLNKALRLRLKSILKGPAASEAKYQSALAALRSAEENGETDQIIAQLRTIEGLAGDADPLQIRMGAKATDLGRTEKIRGVEYFIGDAEARLLNMIDLAKSHTFGKIAFQPLVNYQSLASYEKLMGQEYLWDVIEGRQTPRSYKQAFEEAGIDILEFLEQKDLPKFEIDRDKKIGFPTEDSSNRAKGQPSGHGQWGLYFVIDFTENAPKNDGFHHIRFLGNGDNRKGNPDPIVAGFAIVENKPILKITTPATAIDKKGGKETVRLVQLSREGQVVGVLDQWEEIDAKNSGQERLFYEAGQRNGFGQEGGQLFNTNLFVFNIDLLHPILNQMRSLVGADDFLDAIIPQLFDKSDKAVLIDGKKYVSMDSAIGYVVHRLNTFYSTDPRLEGLRRQFGPQLLYYMNYDRDIFAPKKKAEDQYLQEGTDYYSEFDETIKNFRDAEPGLTPPGFDLSDPMEKDGKKADSKFWNEVQHWLDSLGHSKVRKMRSLKIEGPLTLRNAEYVGDVVILNQFQRSDKSNSATRVVLSHGDYLQQLKDKGYWSEGENHIRLQDVKIIAGVDGVLQIASLDSTIPARAELRETDEKDEKINVAVIGLSPVGLVTAGLLASQGHRVSAFDAAKMVEAIERRKDTIGYETGLTQLLRASRANQRLSVRESLEPLILEAFRDSDVIVVDAGDPVNLEPKEYLVKLTQLAEDVGENLGKIRARGDLDHRILIFRGLLPVGTSRDLLQAIEMKAGDHPNFTFVYMPDYTQTGSTVSESEIVLGVQGIETPEDVDSKLRTASNPAWGKLEQIIKGLNSGESDKRVIPMSLEAAELAKSNHIVYLTTKLGLLGELAKTISHNGGRLQDAAKIAGTDERVGEEFTRPSMALGGRLLQGLEFLFNDYLNRVERKYPGKIPNGNPGQIIAELQAALSQPHLADPRMRDDEYLLLLQLAVILEANKKSLGYFKKQILSNLIAMPQFRGRNPSKPFNNQSVVAIAGVAYKSGTDQITLSPALEIMQWLVEVLQVKKLRIYDPLAIPNLRGWFEGMEKVDPIYRNLDISYEESDPMRVVRKADLVIAGAPLEQLQSLPLDDFKRNLGDTLFADGVSLYEIPGGSDSGALSVKDVIDAGINYLAFGSPAVGPVFKDRPYRSRIIRSEEPLPIQRSPQDIAFIGSGYVGSVNGVVAADAGHNVTLIDIDAEKINTLKQGHLPIKEKGMRGLLRGSLKAGRLFFALNSPKLALRKDDVEVTRDTHEAIQKSSMVFISLNTPEGEHGKVNLDLIETAIRQNGKVLYDMKKNAALEKPKLIVIKSTFPGIYVGNFAAILESEFNLENGRDFILAVNPEFLVEGDAVRGATNPNRTVFGIYSPSKAPIPDEAYDYALSQLLQFVAPIRQRHPHTIIITDEVSATAGKYASNSLLAAFVSLANLYGASARSLNTFYHQWIEKALRSDPRISLKTHSACGPGYGGHCFPKDLRALDVVAKSTLGIDQGIGLIETADLLNEIYKRRTAWHLAEHFASEEGAGGEQPLKGRTISLSGLVFKEGTDDVRESASVINAIELVLMGAEVSLFDINFESPTLFQRIEGNFKDEFARIFIKNFSKTERFIRAYGDIRDEKAAKAAARDIIHDYFNAPEPPIKFIKRPDFQNEDAVIVLGNEPYYREVKDLSAVKGRTADRLSRVVFDARNVLSREAVEKAGLYSPGIGRPDYGIRAETRSAPDVLNDLRSSILPTRAFRSYLASLVGADFSNPELQRKFPQIQLALDLGSHFPDLPAGAFLGSVLPALPAPIVIKTLQSVFLPEALANNGSNPIEDLVRRHLGAEFTQALSNQGSIAIHPIVPIGDSTIQELPASALIYLLFAGPDEPITFVVKKPREEARALKQRFETRYPLSALMKSNLEVIGIGKDGDLAREIRKLAAEDQTHRIGILHRDPEFLQRHFSALRQVRASGEAGHIYELINDYPDWETGIMWVGELLRNPIPDTYRISVSRFASQYGIPNMAQKMGDLIRAIQHFAIHA